MLGQQEKNAKYGKYAATNEAKQKIYEGKVKMTRTESSEIAKETKVHNKKTS